MTKEIAENIIISRLAGDCDNECYKIIEEYKDKGGTYLYMYYKAIIDDSIDEESAEEIYNDAVNEFLEIFNNKQ